MAFAPQLAKSQNDPPVGVPISAQRADHLGRAFFGEIAAAKIVAFDSGDFRVMPPGKTPPLMISPYSDDDGADLDYCLTTTTVRPGLCVLFRIRKDRAPVAYDVIRRVWNEMTSPEAIAEQAEFKARHAR
ncbi:MAG: hypothetical protein IPK26_14755 [Planctomycetes bacterium]|nr:hypothetical protein [Planctomycetota bacterium]